MASPDTTIIVDYHAAMGSQDRRAASLRMPLDHTSVSSVEEFKKAR